jgi:ADP-ribose pyrophosphatase YjhB (NUDIX family)
MVVPVKEGERTGVLVIRRGIEPKKGLLALPGGFVNHGESWQQGGAREVLEETGLVLKAEQITLLDVHSAPPGPRSSNLLIFGLHPEIPAETLPVFEPTDETEELCVLFEAVELAFPLHSLMLKRFFDSR